MYGKNFLNDKKDITDISNQIIAIFIKLRIEKIHYVPISYLLKKLEYNEDDIYDTMHILLDEGVVELYEFERCPICSNEQIVKKHKYKSICSNCKDIFYSDFVVEKFKLLD